MFHGTYHYKWWFSIVMLNYQRVIKITYNLVLVPHSSEYVWKSVFVGAKHLVSWKRKQYGHDIHPYTICIMEKKTQWLAKLKHQRVCWQHHKNLWLYGWEPSHLCWFVNPINYVYIVLTIINSTILWVVIPSPHKDIQVQVSSSLYYINTPIAWSQICVNPLHPPWFLGDA